MKFLNKKEQVIDLQLTQYGKHLLSKGKLKPTYYAFFDDNILYDGRYGGVTGSQNSIQNRIITDTPQLEAQYVFRGIETEVKKSISQTRSSEEYQNLVHNPDLPPPIMSQPVGDKLYGLQYPIGTSDSNTEKVPAWKITFLNGVISSSANLLTGAYSPINIPQLNAKDIEYKTIVKQTQEGEIPSSDVTLFGDTYLDIISGENSVILQIEELNTFFGHDNYEVEIYEIQQEQIVSGTVGPTNKRTLQKEVYVPLYFTKPKDSFTGDILPDQESFDEIEPYEDSTTEIDPSYVEYFLEVNVDNEIDQDVLCNYIVDESQGIFSSKVIECQKAKRQKGIDTQNVFDTDVSEEDLGGCE